MFYNHGDTAGGISYDYSYADPVLNQQITAIALASIPKAENSFSLSSTIFLASSVLISSA